MKNHIDQYTEKRIAKLTSGVLGVAIALPSFFVIVFTILDKIA
jgi:hypothetical protein